MRTKTYKHSNCVNVYIRSEHEYRGKVKFEENVGAEPGLCGSYRGYPQIKTQWSSVGWDARY